jgi:enterochelin esterase-like enzyme
MRFSKFSIGITCTLVLLLSSVYFYVFVLGAPQFDPPKEIVDTSIKSKLKFKLESFKSEAMGRIREYGVIFPPDYNQNSGKRYPVIFLLHGGHDNARAYVDKYAIVSVLNELYKTKKLPPVFIIMPDGNDLRGSSPLYDPEYFDGKNGKIGTLIGSELVAVVKARYSTLEDPKYWALGGISSGGWGAFNIGLRYLNNFNILFSHSGYFIDNSGVENSPQRLVQKIPNQELKKLRVYLDAGKNDIDLLASTELFHETLNKVGVENVFYQFPGGHGLSGANIGWNYFHKHLKNSLSYVGSQFEKDKSKELDLRK